MILPLQYIAEWDLINARKQSKIDESNIRENKKHVEWDYKIGDFVLITSSDIQRKLDRPTMGPYEIAQVYTNGSVRVKRGPMSECINIRRCTPFHQ